MSPHLLVSIFKPTMSTTPVLGNGIERIRGVSNARRGLVQCCLEALHDGIRTVTVVDDGVAFGRARVLTYDTTFPATAMMG